MSEVIVRSLATSFCTVLPVLALFFFGGETLQDFAFALIIGTLSGAYSSVFIAGPVLVHWKEREPVYRTRHRRIKEQLGYVPAYAVATAGAPVDVEPDASAARAASVTAPQDPTQVSREDFDDMVANLGIEDDGSAKRPTAAAARPAGPPAGAARVRGPEAATGRRWRAPRRRRGRRGGRAPPEDPDKPKKPRNRRHGRPR